MNVKVYILKLTNQINILELEILSNYIFADRKNRKYIDIYQWKVTIYTDLLLKYGISMIDHTVNIDEMEIIYNEYGKPYLSANDEIFFNITHTENFIAIAFNDNEIGIDIEIDGKVQMNIVKRFFHNQEKKIIEEIYQNRITEVWCMKEAYCKFKGMGLALPFDRFNVFSSEINKKFHAVKVNNLNIVLFKMKEKNIDFYWIDEKKIYSFFRDRFNQDGNSNIVKEKICQ